MHTTAYMLMSEGSLWELVLFLNHVGSRESDSHNQACRKMPAPAEPSGQLPPSLQLPWDPSVSVCPVLELQVCAAALGFYVILARNLGSHVRQGNT